jgi:purine-binding chemotaxis protein CheW
MQSSVLANRPAADAAKTDPRAGKYLTFQVGKEEFALPVLHVREIMGVQEITAVPQMPNHVKGVLNLRGKVIPVVDLRLKFGMQELEYTQRTCIIVVQIEGQMGRISTGIIVDGVSEVLTLQTADIEDTPDFGMGAATPYLLGLAKIKGKVKILLDINKVIQDV